MTSGDMRRRQTKRCAERLEFIYHTDGQDSSVNKKETAF